ncbi:MAG: hypothetical protein ACRENE_02190 [Polyangiaceae bacterium]
MTAVGVSLAACGGSTTNNNANPHSSHTGESCLTTGDCMNSDVCISNVCVAGPGASTGDGGTGSSSGASSSGGSSSGGSSSSGGTTTPEAAPAHLGARGDSCTSTPDCAAGLSCIKNGVGGICDITSYGLASTVTGKVCGGECNQASDCCELPVDTFTVGATPIHHCSDLAAIIGTSPCQANGTTGPLSQACFLQTAYCGSCGPNWSCTGNRCLYTAQCSQGNTGVSPVVGGCAPTSRLGNGLTTVCNATSMKCAGTVSTTGCSADADCTSNPYTAFGTATAGICQAPNGTGGDCVCLAKACYLACSKDLDCATGYTCDTAGTRTCKPVGACTNDTQCIQTFADVAAKCSSGKCVKPCSSDHDCSQFSGSTLTTNFGGDVCVIASGSTTGTCQSIYNNCSMDSDCDLPASGTAVAETPHTFCISTASSSTTTYFSAITN